MPQIVPINLFAVYLLTWSDRRPDEYVAVQLDSQWRPLGVVPRSCLGSPSVLPCGRWPAATAEEAIAAARAPHDALRTMLDHVLG
jgi:hypothetical protein